MDQDVHEKNYLVTLIVLDPASGCIVSDPHPDREEQWCESVSISVNPLNP